MATHAVRVITYGDAEWELYKDKFYENFCPDDWDYIIVGSNEFDVEMIAQKLMVCDYQIKQVGDEWIAVTYHS